MRRFTAIDLFSGCGGLTVGLKAAGFAVLAAVELEPLAAETYADNHPDVSLYREDIRAIDPANAMAHIGLRPGDLDLLAGCPPCQGFSSMRTLNGARDVDDPRNDLVSTYLDWVVALQPKAVMMENVPGLGTDPRFAALNEALAEMGYHPRHYVLNAADYGVPQRRRRLLLVGSQSGPVPAPAEVTPRPTVRDAIGHLPPAGTSGDPLHDVPANYSARVVDLLRRVPHDGGSRLALGDDDRLACHRRCDGFRDVYGRMAWDDVSPTITSGCVNPSKGRFVHPVADRAITLREAALLQSFPAGYRFSLSRGKYAAAQMVGNAFPPAMAAAQAAMVVTSFAKGW